MDHSLEGGWLLLTITLDPNRGDRDRYVSIIVFQHTIVPPTQSGAAAARRVLPVRLTKQYSLVDGRWLCTRVSQSKVRWGQIRHDREPTPRDALQHMRAQAAEFNRCWLIGEGLLNSTEEALTQAG